MSHTYVITVSYEVESDRPLTPDQLEDLRRRAEDALGAYGGEGELMGDVVYDEELEDYYGTVSSPTATIQEDSQEASTEAP